MTKKATENMRNTIYDRGDYWCSTCQVKVKKEDTYTTRSGLGGAIKHNECGRAVRTRRRYKRKGTPHVVSNVVDVDGSHKNIFTEVVWKDNE